MSGVLAKMVLTVALGAICAVVALIATRPVQAQHTYGPGGRGGGGGGQRRRSPSPKRRNNWHDYSNDSDSGNETFHTPPETLRKRGSNTEEKAICTICLDTFEEAKREGKEIYTTPCGHLFCKPCLTDSLTSSSEKKCPSCRKRVPVNAIHRVFI